MALSELGRLALMGADYAAARALSADAWTRFQEQGDLRNGALVLGSQGWLAGHQGNFPAARTLLEQSLALLRELLGGRADIFHTTWIWAASPMPRATTPPPASCSSRAWP